MGVVIVAQTPPAQFPERFGSWKTAGKLIIGKASGTLQSSEDLLVYRLPTLLALQHINHLIRPSILEAETYRHD